VQTVCDTGATIFSPTITFQTVGCPGCRINYCLTGGDDASEEWIDSVYIHTLTNGSGSDNGYGDFTGGSLTTALMQSQTYNVRLVPGFQSSPFDEYFRIWIDFNNDGDFSDALELIYDSGPGVNAAVTGSFVMPSNGITGGTRMRVAMRYLDPPASCGPNFDYGEVEDYCVDVLPFTVNQEEPTTSRTVAYPNPFKDRLNIDFELAAPTDVSIALYSTLGNKVAEMELPALGSGAHQQVLSTNDLSEGVYLLHLQMGQRSETIRVTLMNK
jgi:hypothetical protein